MSKRIPTSSVSQVENYRGCKRKWYYSSVDYLPQEPRRATAIGDCLHAVLERYLEVDEQGLDKDGNPPELYPEGWELQKDYFGKKVLFALDLTEQKLIKDLVDKSISEGTIIRRPGGHVEYQEKILITPDISFQVRIDYAYDWTIEDHKSCKNFRYTLVEDKKHQRYIGKDVQLKVYAYFWALKRNKETGEEIPEYLTIRHNQFCVDGSKEIRIVSTKVTFEDCKKEYEALKEVVLEQLEVRNTSKTTENFNAWKVEKDLDNCSKYGGCPYKKVCVAQEMPAFYKKRIQNKIDELTAKLQIKKEDQMGFNIKKGNTGATKAQDAVLQEVEQEQSAPTVASLKEELAKVEAQAKAMGMDVSATPKGKELLEAIGKLEAIEKKAKEAKEAKEAKVKAEKEAKEKADAEALAKSKAEDKKVAAEKAELQKKVKEEPAAVEEKKEAPSETKEEADFSISASARAKETVICIGCYPVSGKQVKTISLHAVFAAAAATMGKENDCSYYDLDPFKRRESFEKHASEILKQVSGVHIIAPSVTTPDETAFLNALLQDKNVRAYRA